jgi:hypothetical protein
MRRDNEPMAAPPTRAASIGGRTLVWLLLSTGVVVGFFATYLTIFGFLAP